MIRKRLTAVLMSVAMIFSYSVNSMADEVTDITEEVAIEETSEEETILQEGTSEEDILDGATLEEDISDEEFFDGFVSGYIDTGERIEPYKRVNSGLRQSNEIPSYYDSRTTGCITPVRNQNPYGTCWTFAALGVGETNLVKNKGYDKDVIDLSELQLAYFAYHQSEDPMENISGDYVYLNPGYNYLAVGGNDYFSMFSLSAWRGAVDENLVPYSNSSDSDLSLDNSYAFLNDMFHLQNTYIASMGDSDIVKSFIMEYGAVASGIYYPEDDVSTYYNNLGSHVWASYQDESIISNHAIMIIGWDDDYSVENFNPSKRPTSNGAWLIKNSWGDYNKPYIWISYEDLCLSKEDAFVYLFEKADNYDYNYQYDGGLSSLSVQYYNGDAFSNVYNVYGDEIQEIDAVSIAVAEDKVSYELQIYLNPTAGDPLSGTPLLETPQTGTIDYAGYNTIPLVNPQRLYSGDSFAVVFKLYDNIDDGKIWLFF